MKHLMIAASLLLISMSTAFAQVSLEELNTMLSDEKGQQKLTKMGLLFHNHQANKIPSKYYVEDPLAFKRVGILTLMVKQYAGESQTTSNSTWGFSTTESFRLTDPALQAMGTIINGEFVEAMKAQGADMGIEVLTPSEYLSSDSLVTEYLNIELESSFRDEGVVNSMGYRNFPELTRPGSLAGLGGVKYASFWKLGELAQKCKLDAYILAVVNVYPSLNKNDERKLLFYNIALTNILVNQTPKEEGRKYPKLLGGYVSLPASGYSLLSAGGAPIMQYAKVSDGPIVDESVKVYPGGGLSTGTTSMPTVNTVTNNLDQLGDAMSKFSALFLQTSEATVQGLNKKNKLE